MKDHDIEGKLDFLSHIYSLGVSGNHPRTYIQVVLIWLEDILDTYPRTNPYDALRKYYDKFEGFPDD